METVIRAAVIYTVLWLMFRLSGKRTFSEMTSFDFVLLLIISEAVQQALIGEDFSITAAVLVILTLVGIDVGLSLLKQNRRALERVMDGMPVIIVEHGKPLQTRMEQERIDDEDILDEARKRRGLERMDQIKYAVLERNGGISIIPYGVDDRELAKA